MFKFVKKVFLMDSIKEQYEDSKPKKIICIDPGHGKNKKGFFERPLMKIGMMDVEILSGGKPHPEDGAPRTYREDTGTLKIAKKLREALEVMGYKVVLTREDERNAKEFQKQTFVNEHGGIGLWRKKWPKWKWIKWVAKENDADLFISLHTNAGGGSGPVAFWAHKKSKKLGEILCRTISKYFNLNVRGVKKRRFLILRNIAKKNSILFEIMFHDSPRDLRLLISEKQTNRISQAMAEGIHEFLEHDSGR